MSIQVLSVTDVITFSPGRKLRLVFPFKSRVQIKSQVLRVTQVQVSSLQFWHSNVKSDLGLRLLNCNESVITH